MKAKGISHKKLVDAATVVVLVALTIFMVALPYIVNTKTDILVSSLGLIEGWFSFWAIIPAAIVFLVLTMHFKQPVLRSFIILFCFNLVSALLAIVMAPSVANGLFLFITGASFKVDSAILVLIITLIDYLLLKSVFKLRIQVLHLMFLMLYVANFISFLIGINQGAMLG